MPGAPPPRASGVRCPYGARARCYPSRARVQGNARARRCGPVGQPAGGGGRSTSSRGADRPRATACRRRRCSTAPSLRRARRYRRPCSACHSCQTRTVQPRDSGPQPRPRVAGRHHRRPSRRGIHLPRRAVVVYWATVRPWYASPRDAHRPPSGCSRRPWQSPRTSRASGISACRSQR